MTRHYSIYEAKAKLSEVIRQVKQDVRVVITERGKPVAEVVPIKEDASLASRLDTLIASGQAVAATEPISSLGPVAEVPGALKRFLESRD